MQPSHDDDELFAGVVTNENGPNACSPHQEDPSWTGILIRAPSRVELPAAAFGEGRRLAGTIPICGYSHLEALALKKAGKPMVLVAEDARTKDRFAGEVHTLDENRLIPPPAQLGQPPDEDLQGLRIGTYFNPNLLDFVALPARPATYLVHAEQAGATSNAVTIAIAEKK